MSRRIKTNYSDKGSNITLVMTLEGYVDLSVHHQEVGQDGDGWISRKHVSFARRSGRDGFEYRQRSNRSVSAGEESARYLTEVMSRWNLKPAPLVTRL
jgi:hypothetical protein